MRFATQDEAAKGIADHHGTDLEGRTLTVKFDKCATARLVHCPLHPVCVLS